ncbi:hypothetical protein b3_0137 [Synechococcus phage B3]|nr:hypothetical protein b3_0137 [Synechococcus phage B3]QGT54751.1 hypothetical protein b23_0136 [Synechococcus phage B23]
MTDAPDDRLSIQSRFGNKFSTKDLIHRARIKLGYDSP